MIRKSGNRFSGKTMRERQPSSAIMMIALEHRKASGEDVAHQASPVRGDSVSAAAPGEMIGLLVVYLPAEKRLSNEFADTTGWAPATRLFEAAGAAAGAGVSAAVSVTAGLSAGLAEACLVSVFAGFGLASATLGLAGVGVGCGVVVPVASAAALPPRPTLRARLEKKPSDSPLCAGATDCAAGAAEATRVDGAVEVVPNEAARGSFGEVTGPRGGLTVSGMVPGALSAVANGDGLGPASERPVLPLGSLAANTLCMPPSMPVLSCATGVPFATSLANSASSACCFSRTASATSSGTT